MRLASMPLLGHGSKWVLFTCMETRMVTPLLTPQGFQVETRVTKTLCKLTHLRLREFIDTYNQIIGQ